VGGPATAGRCEGDRLGREGRLRRLLRPAPRCPAVAAPEAKPEAPGRWRRRPGRWSWLR
jgi:hypothetical protein